MADRSNSSTDALGSHKDRTQRGTA